jgi:hypothetical protein
MRILPSWENELWNYVSSGDGITARANYRNCEPPSKSSDRVLGHQYPLYNVQTQESGHNTNEVIKPGRINELVEMLAQSWLKKGGINKAPIPGDLVQMFDQSREINVRKLPLKACHGAVWKTGNSWEIYLNSKDSLVEQRVTLFHEGFHIMAHVKANPVFKKPGNPEGSYNEYLADSFAYKILMPQKWIEKDWAELKNQAALARKFQVPRKAVALRLTELNLI